MPNVRTLISLNRAMKKTLRKKADFNIPEGFLSELLKENHIIYLIQLYR